MACCLHTSTPTWLLINLCKWIGPSRGLGILGTWNDLKYSVLNWLVNGLAAAEKSSYWYQMFSGGRRVGFITLNILSVIFVLFHTSKSNQKPTEASRIALIVRKYFITKCALLFFRSWQYRCWPLSATLCQLLLCSLQWFPLFCNSALQSDHAPSCSQLLLISSLLGWSLNIPSQVCDQNHTINMF